MKYLNPIIPGFSPDPSIVRVDNVFYLVTSTFHVFPGLPIYASTDLNNWSHIGNAINRNSQLDLTEATTTARPKQDQEPFISTAGLWAATIRYHAKTKTFYIVCTNCAQGEMDIVTRNFYISTSNVWDDRWSDPIFFDFNGIDPSLFFDEDGRSYVQGCWRLRRGRQPTCTIKQFEIDIYTGRPLSETKEIWEGWAKVDSEGPHIYRKDGWYYLLLAEGGTFEHHMLTIARSNDIWGPYEPYEHNPILTSDGKDEYIQHTGHGELFADQHGDWWAVVLGVRNDKGIYPMGRETFLTPMTWPENGWPKIEQPRLSFERDTKLAEANSKSLASIPPRPRIDDVYIRNPNQGNYRFLETQSQGMMSCWIKASSNDLTAFKGDVTFVGKRQRQQVSAAEVSMRHTSNVESRGGMSLQYGLAIYKDNLRHATVSFDGATASIVLKSTRKSRLEVETIAQVEDVFPQTNPRFQKIVCLRIQSSKQRYTFQYRPTEDKDWIELGSISCGEMTGRDFTGTIFGVFACWVESSKIERGEEAMVERQDGKEEEEEEEEEDWVEVSKFVVS